jgi:hypothetical protein
MSVRGALAAALLAAAALPMAGMAQTRPAVELIPQAGYAMFGDLWSGPVGTSVRSANGAFYGLQAGLNITPVIGLTGSVGYARTDLEAGLPIIGGAAFGTSETVYYDAGVQLRVPLQGAAVSPFVQAGAGGVHHALSSGILDVTSNSPAFHVGGGLDLDLTRNVGLRLQLRDYIARFDAREAIALDVSDDPTHTLAFTMGLRVGF